MIWQNQINFRLVKDQVVLLIKTGFLWRMEE